MQQTHCTRLLFLKIFPPTPISRSIIQLKRKKHYGSLEFQNNVTGLCVWCMFYLNAPSPFLIGSCMIHASRRGILVKCRRDKDNIMSHITGVARHPSLIYGVFIYRLVKRVPHHHVCGNILSSLSVIYLYPRS